MRVCTCVWKSASTSSTDTMCNSCTLVKGPPPLLLLVVVVRNKLVPLVPLVLSAPDGDTGTDGPPEPTGAATILLLMMPDTAADPDPTTAGPTAVTVRPAPPPVAAPEGTCGWCGWWR